MPFLDKDELSSMGFLSLGKSVKVSKDARIYNPELTTLDDYSRIDDFCVISGAVSLGKYVHVASSCIINASNYKIVLEDFSALAYRCTVFCVSDDYTGEFLTNPNIPAQFRNTSGGNVMIGAHSIVGSGTVIFPGVKLGEGCAIGSMSLVNKSLEPWTISIGIPARVARRRRKDLLALLNEWQIPKED